MAMVTRVSTVNPDALFLSVVTLGEMRASTTFALVTPNVTDSRDIGVDVVNPWAG